MTTPYDPSDSPYGASAYSTGPTGGPTGGPPAGWPVPTQDERNWAVAAHLGSFVAAWIALGFLAPLTVLLVKGKDSAFIRHQAMESLNFQLTTLLAVIISGVLALVLVGLFMLVAVGIAYLILVIMAAVKSSSGEWYRYPLTIRFFS